MSDITADAPRVRRSYNKLVNNPVLEDYSLRYAPKSFRTWSSYAVASAALGGIAYLADQAIGGSLAVQFGFANAFWGILAAALVIFLQLILSAPFGFAAPLAVAQTETQTPPAAGSQCWPQPWQ